MSYVDHVREIERMETVDEALDFRNICTDSLKFGVKIELCGPEEIRKLIRAVDYQLDWFNRN